MSPPCSKLASPTGRGPFPVPASGGGRLELADGARCRPVRVRVAVGALRAHRALAEADVLVVPQQVLPRGRADDAVGADPGVRLEGADRRLRGGAEGAVRREAGRALGVEQRLDGPHRGPVVALAYGDGERVPGGGADDAVGGQPFGLLEGHDGAAGAGAEHAVHGHGAAVRRQHMLECDDVGAPVAVARQRERGLREGLRGQARPEEEGGHRREQCDDAAESSHDALLTFLTEGRPRWRCRRCRRSSGRVRTGSRARPARCPGRRRRRWSPSGPARR